MQVHGIAYVLAGAGRIEEEREASSNGTPAATPIPRP
jgi:hypothetical protein